MPGSCSATGRWRIPTFRATASRFASAATAARRSCSRAARCRGRDRRRIPVDVAELQQPGPGLRCKISSKRRDAMGAIDMRKLLPGSAAIIVLGLCIPAMAADLDVGAPTYKAARPVMRTYDWTGFYVGGNVGGHWGSDKITTTTDPGGGFGAAGAAAIDAAYPATLHPEGFIGGLQ